MTKQEGFKNFEEFYPFYLEEHSDKTNRILHFIGTSILIIVLILAIYSRNFRLMWFCPLIGYGFAWVGHFVFEKNRPATFKHPLYSLRSDFKMWWQLLTRKIYF
jgi:hypothetical protein